MRNKFLSIFSKKHRNKISEMVDVNKLQEKNNMYKAAFSGISSNIDVMNMFGGSKINGSLNYPSTVSLNTKELRERSRKSVFDTTQSAAILNRMDENVINSGLTLESTPMWNLCSPKKSKEERKEWTTKTEQYWQLYSNSKETSYDKKKTFQQLQSIFYYNLLRDGEVFTILRYSSNKNGLNPMTIQIIDSANVVDPDFKVMEAAEKAGRKIIDGIEFSKTGEEIAYYVQDTTTWKVKKIVKIGIKSKRAFVIHSMITEYVDQARGIPYLSGVLHELQKITDYSLLELQAAVINAVLAVWVKPSQLADSSLPMAGVKAKDVFQDPEASSIVDSAPSKADFTKGGLIVQNLKKGEEIQSFDTKRPNVNFEGFVTAIMKNLSSSKSIPMEVLNMTFGQNYSASRASLLLFWTNVIKHRANFVADILNPIFEMWMIGEVEAGRIEAAGFNNMLTRKAWLNKRWIGISQPSIDPLKEAKADTERMAQGASTRENTSRKYNGTSFDDNIEKLTEENEKLSKANEPFLKEVEKSPTGDQNGK